MMIMPPPSPTTAPKEPARKPTTARMSVETRVIVERKIIEHTKEKASRTGRLFLSDFYAAEDRWLAGVNTDQFTGKAPVVDPPLELGLFPVVRIVPFAAGTNPVPVSKSDISLIRTVDEVVPPPENTPALLLLDADELTRFMSEVPALDSAT